MTVELLLWGLVAGLAGWCGRMQWWITQHHKTCHSEPLVKVAQLEQRISACEREAARNSKNWHNLRAYVAPLYLWLQYIMEKLGIKATALPAPVQLADEEQERQE